MNVRLAVLAAASLVLAQHAIADQVISDDLIVTSNLCVGSVTCVNGEIFGDADIKIKSSNPELFFDDTGVQDDWTIATDDLSSPSSSAFVIRNDTNGTHPFGVHDDARTAALWIDQSGRMGLGTSLPSADVHIMASGNLATLRMEEQFGTPYVYEVRASNGGFRVQDVTSNSFPFFLNPGAPNNAINVNTDGNIGLGTSIPQGKLHSFGTGTQLAYLESSDGGAVQVRFRTDSQNRRFLAVNNANEVNEVKSQIVFGDNQIQFLGQTVAQEWLRISSAGIVSSGPTCNPNPCDATFDPDQFTVPPIEERAAYMWENQHCPQSGRPNRDSPST